MYASGENSGNVPAFLMKVWTLVEDPSTDELIFWDASGTSFHVFDQQRFSREILPMYFKHNNIASFIRQLNMYGFRKVAHIDQGGLKIENDDLHFQHHFFQRGEKELLQHIKRKVSSQQVRSDALTAVKNDEVSRVLTDVNQIKSKQQDTDQNLEYIKRENKLLWKEIATLRQKHHKQQEIVNKLIQFLVSLVRTNRTGLTIPPLRRVPLAIDSNQVVAAPVSTASAVSDLEEQLVAAIPHNYTIESPKAGEMVTLTSPSTGPIIHELSETSPNFLNSPRTATSSINVQSPSVPEETNSVAPRVILDVNSSPVMVLNQVANVSGLSQPLLSPKIEQAPSLEDALNFDWASYTPDIVSSAPPTNFLSPTSSTSPLISQGKNSNQKRKRTKPTGGLSTSNSSPTKKASLIQPTTTTMTGTSGSNLMSPADILSSDQANSTLDQLVLDSSRMTGGNNKAAADFGNRGDAMLALSASNSSASDDPSVSSNQLDFLNSDLDGLRGLLQDHYKLDPAVLLELFESSTPWPIVSDKTEDDLSHEKEEPSTSADNPECENIVGNEVVQYNPKELFPELLDDGVIGDIDDID